VAVGTIVLELNGVGNSFDACFCAAVVCIASRPTRYPNGAEYVSAGLNDEAATNR